MPEICDFQCQSNIMKLKDWKLGNLLHGRIFGGTHEYCLITGLSVIILALCMFYSLKLMYEALEVVVYDHF